MSDPCPTLESLVELGFEHRTTGAGLEGIGYRFVHLDLDAVHVMNLYGRYTVLLSGVLNTGRTMAVIEEQIPNDLGTALEAAAWLSYALKSHESDLRPIPEWFVEGKLHWDLVFARMNPEGWERQRAYRDCPKCFIDREYARPLRRRLSEELSSLDGETGMVFSFDGHVLSIVLNGTTHEVVASGDKWPSSYRAFVSQETKLPARFQSWTVEVSVFEDRVRFDRLRFGPCEAVT